MYKNIFVMLNLAVSFILAIIFSNFAIIIVNLILLLTLLAILKREDKDIYKHLIIIYLISIFAMVILYFGYLSKYGNPYYSGGSDDENFEIWANKAIQSNNYTINDIMQNREFKYYNCNGFIWFVSILIRFCDLFGGYHTIILRMLNIYLLIFIGILTFKYFYKEIEKISKSSIGILYITTLFPNALYISIHGFRDTLFAFIIFSVFYLTVNIKEQKILTKILRIVYIVFVSYLAYYIREVGAIYITLIIFLNLTMPLKRKNNEKTILLFGAIFILGIFLAMKFNLIENIGQYSTRYNEYILEGADGLSNYVFSLPIIPLGIILRIVYGNIFPAPTGILLNSFDIDSICHFIISIGTIFQIYMLPYLAKNIKEIDNICLIYIVMFFSIILTTFSFRHFLILYPFMFILMFRQFEKAKEQEKKIYMSLVTILMLLGTIVYLIYQIV